MRTRTEKKNSGRKWAARGALLVVLLVCGFLLTKCGDKPALVLNGDGGAALSQGNDLGERLGPQGMEQSKAEGVRVKEEKESLAKVAGSLQQSGRADESNMSQLDPGAGTEIGLPLVQAQQLNPGDKDPEFLAQKPTELPAEISPFQKKNGEVAPGEPQVALKNDDKEAAIFIGEQESLCPGGPTAKGLVAEDEIPSGKIFTDPVTKMSFVLVKGGCFKMGSNKGNSDEMPVHEVCVDDFYMGEYEVTQAQYEWIMGHNPSSFNGCDSPVESVSWEDAQAYIRKLSQVSRKNYRLPSEAEWEYAARSDWKDETTSSIDPMLQEYAWYIKNLGNQPSSVERRPNGLGLYDMDHNVWEWVSDWYGANYYANSPRTNPQGPPSGSRRVIRAGNGSRNEPGFAKRYGASPNERSNYFGFRVAFQARSSANGLPAKAQKPGISSSADSPFQDDVAVLNVESVSRPASR